MSLGLNKVMTLCNSSMEQGAIYMSLFVCLFVVVVQHPASSLRALSRLPKGKDFQLSVFLLF